MTSIAGTIHAPIIGMIAQEILALVKNDYALRALQGINAQQACYFDQRSITGATVYHIDEAFIGTGEVFSSVVLTFDTLSGSGRYRVDGVDPTATTGHQVPSGGGILTITGHPNVARFGMQAEAGQTLIFARNLYK